MPVIQIERILAQHNIVAVVSNGRLLAEELSVDRNNDWWLEWIDVTDFDRAALYAWLGY